MFKIIRIENLKDETGICPECGGKIIVNSFKKICKEYGLVINNFYRESSFIFHNLKKQNNLSKKYIDFSERPDFIGGLGLFIDYEKSKYLKDKSGKLSFSEP